MKGIIVAIMFLFVVDAQAQKPEGLFIKAKAPDFKATDQNGNVLSLKDMRKSGPVVLMFYRGNWCPFCSRQLKAYQDSLEFITAKGARLVAITPEGAEGVGSTIEKTGASFSIISDGDMAISKSYGVSFKPEDELVQRYKRNGVDLAQVNGQKQPSLPVPAVYIINSEGDIIYRYFDENYRNRPSVAELLKHLK